MVLPKDFAASFKGFLDQVSAAAPEEDPVFRKRLREHLGQELDHLPILAETFAPYDHANLHIAGLRLAATSAGGRTVVHISTDEEKTVKRASAKQGRWSVVFLCLAAVVGIAMPAVCRSSESPRRPTADAATRSAKIRAGRVGKVAAGSGALPTEYELQATGPPRKWKIADLSRRIAETGAAVARGERQRAELQAVRGSAAGGYGGMALDSTSEEKRGIRVVTTGAVYFFDRTKNQIECSQRIPNLRKVAVISGLSLQTVKLDGPLAEQCKLSAGKDSFVVSRDSLLRIGFAGPATIVLRGLYQPSCQQNVDNDFFLPDEQGGVAACLVLGKAVMERSAGWAPGWRLRYAVSEPGELWVSVFPPRPFPWRQSYETMLHSFSCNRPFPSDSDLADWRRYGSILTLHSWVWKGKFGSQYGVEDDESYKAREFEPKSQGELRRVIETAHRLNMKVIVYMSPYYAADPTPQGIEDFVRRVRERIQQYGFDGVYFDGAAREVRPAYEFVVRTRQALGNDAVLHLHLTGVPSLVCPFIDCHADYILRGEHLGLSEEYARWFVSGYQLSNSIGTFCYDRLRVNKDLIDRLLRVHARLPFWVGDGTWHGAKYHLTEAEQQTMRDHYYPALEKQRASQDSSRTR